MEFLADILWGGVYLLIEGLLTIVETMVSAIDVSSIITTSLAQWDVLPGPMLYLINSMGIPPALSIVGYAYGIRFLLNLIPASLTRV